VRGYDRCRQRRYGKLEVIGEGLIFSRADYLCCRFYGLTESQALPISSRILRSRILNQNGTKKPSHREGG
jgi:hypothetical protein